MNNRLNTQELAELISQYTSKDKKEVEAFLREFVALVVDGVCRDQVVKVKGVGTFKIIQVEKRESIHVNTGERFLIPAHYKFSFLPDKDLREQVNKPFSIFETTEIGDDVDYASFQESDNREEGDEEESVEEVMPDKEIPLSSNDQEERTEDLPLSEEEPSAEKEPEESIKLVEEPVPSDPEPDPNPEPVEPEPAVEPAPVSEAPAPEPERPGKSLGWGRYVMVAVVVLADVMQSDVWVEDAAIASIYMQLQAEDLGLGSCWCQIRNRQTADDEDAAQYVRGLLNVPYQLEVLSIIGFGHKENAAKPFDESKLQWEKIHLGAFRPAESPEEGGAHE